MSLRQFDREELGRRLATDNPWWAGMPVPSRYVDLKHRLYFDAFYREMRQKKPVRAIVLMGPRRVGKTVMLYQAIYRLIREGVDPKRIIYISLEKPMFLGFRLEALWMECIEVVGGQMDEPWYLFFDEIQYLPDWERDLKVLVDDHPQCKIIVSGSAAAALRLKSRESGAGRFTEFLLPPLLFAEFIELKGLGQELVTYEHPEMSTPMYKSIDIERFNAYFEEYVLFGGYPEVVISPEIKENPEQYIGSDIIDKVLLKDLPGLFGIRNVQELYRFFNVVAYNTANEMSVRDLVRQGLGAEEEDKNRKYKVDEFLEYLEAAYLVKKLSRVDINARGFKREHRYKLFLNNPSLFTALFGRPRSLDHLVETAVFSQYLHREFRTIRYANWDKGEVDFVNLEPGTQKPSWAVEVKWTNRYYEHPNELKSLRAFLALHPVSGWVTTKNITDLSGSIKFMPVSLFCYMIGIRALSAI